MIRRRRRRKVLILPSILWVIFILYLISTTPDTILSYALFYILLAPAIFSTCKIFLEKITSLLVSLGVILLLLFQQLGINSPSTTILLLGTITTLHLLSRER